MSAEDHSSSHLEIARLRAENEYLRGKLAKNVVRQQESLELSHRLDQEAARFRAMQDFIQLAVLTEEIEELGVMVCESIIDLLECGVGMLWCLNSPQSSRNCLFNSGLGDVSEEMWEEMKKWVEGLLASRARCNSADTSWKNSLPPLPAGFGLRSRFLVEVVVDGFQMPQGVLIACNTSHQARFHDLFPHSADTVFATFARQVGVIVVSFKRRSTIIEQIERIRISEERLSTALIGSNVGLWDWDLATDRVFYSDQWKQQLGMEVDEIGDSLNEWVIRVHPDELPHALQVINACKLVPGGQFDLTLRMRSKNRRWRWINTRGYSVMNSDGVIQRMIGTHIDVTEYKTLESKLLHAEKRQRRAKEQAERESSAKSSFLAAVSHEIRTPLNGMLGAFQMLRMTQESKQREELIRMGENSGKWMLKIIGESLDITRIEAGKIELRSEMVDLWDLLTDLRETKMKAARGLDSGLEFRWNMSPSVPRMVMVDPGRLRQILTNLITNAFKFTQTGFVEVSITAASMGKERWSHVRFEVEDSGIGFSKDFGRVIFHPFTQAQKKSDSSEHGIGLGLGIAKELTSLMGGRISATSKRGVGSRFIVTLPMEEFADERAKGDQMESAAMPSFAGRVLLAEDDEASGMLGKLMMENLGLDVEIAKDGGEALEKASSNKYDLIFMDGWMPVMGGSR